MRGTSKFGISDIEQAKQAFLYYRDVEADAKNKKDKARSSLKNHVAENGDTDSDGHIRWLFEPVTINGVTYNGLMNQRRVSTRIDEERAIALAKKAGVLEQITSYEPVYDFDQLYVLNQEGRISDEELDSIVEVAESYALIPIKED